MTVRAVSRICPLSIRRLLSPTVASAASSSPSLPFALPLLLAPCTLSRCVAHAFCYRAAAIGEPPQGALISGQWASPALPCPGPALALYEHVVYIEHSLELAAAEG